MWVLPLFAVGVAALAYWGWSNGWIGGGGAQGTPVKWHLVAAGEMQVKVHKDGELQAVNNIEIISMVEGLNTIVQIVKEGQYVNQGDTLVTLDSSGIRQKIDDTSLELQRAASDVAAARNVLEIQKSQNEANLEAAEVDVELGKLSIRQYLEGVYPQDLDSAETELRMNKIMVATREDDFKQVKELYGKNFVNLADVKQAELNLETQKNLMNKSATALKVLKEYTHPMMLAGKMSYQKQTEQRLARTKIENQNNFTKAQTALDTTEAAKKILERRMEHLKEQLDLCTIKAPSAGLVVYNNLSSRGDSSAPIQEGTQVRERQILLRLPDTSAMKAVVRINEGQVIRLRSDQRALVRVTGLREPIGASLTRISPVSDSSSRWLNPDTREYPVELTLDWTPPNLKPGIGVQVEILVENVPDAVSVPLPAIYSAGADNFVFTRGDDGRPAPRKVNVGVANETHVQIVEGLKTGEQVVLLQAGQGRELLEKAGVQPSPNDTPKIRKGTAPGKGKTTTPGKKPAAPARDNKKPATPDTAAEAAAADKPASGERVGGAGQTH
jgi:HlyD family secretion protein